jgi:hypothetical protein
MVGAVTIPRNPDFCRRKHLRAPKGFTVWARRTRNWKFPQISRMKDQNLIPRFLQGLTRIPNPNCQTSMM